jgi:hypothetical protein
MKKMVFIAGALMLVVASSAMAGSNMAWNDCVGGGGLPDRTVTCTNSGSGFAYVSLNPSTSYPSIGATDVFIDVNPTTLGTFWNPPTTTTRWGSASTDPLSGACVGWWAAAPNGGITFQPPQALGSGAGKIRLKITTVIGAGEEQPMDPGTEYFMGALQLKFNAGTFGNAECTGGAAIGVADINVLQPGVPDTHEGQVADVSNCVTFRNPAGKQCPGATPTQKSTWGSIKALYR